MSRTPSTMVALGTLAPRFALPDVRTEKTVRLEDFAGRRALLVMFICRHCPFVVHVQGELAKLGRDYEGQDVALVAISSNDVEGYPEDAPDRLAAQAREQGFAFPYLFDETQAVARAYEAACTPDLFLFRREADGFRLAYRGQLDDSRPGNGKPVTGADLRRALDAVLSGAPVPEPQHPSIGCNIKFRGAPS
jgi:peroxiredoxin